MTKQNTFDAATGARKRKHDRRPAARWWRFGLCLILPAAACRSLPKGYEAPPELNVSWEEAKVSREPIGNAGMLFEAALANSRRVRSLQREVDLARANTHTVAGIRDPEVRLGYGWGDGDGTGNSSQTADRQTYSRESGSSTEWNEVTPHELRSTDSTRESGESSRHSDRTRREWESLSDSSWDVGLRLYPPNPWEYAVEVSEAEAKLHLAESELRGEQVEIMEDVVKEFCALTYAQKRLRMWRQLEGLFAKEVERAAQLPMENQTDLMRRVLNVRTRILRLERDVNERRGNLEVLCGRSLELDTLNTSLDWLPEAGDGVALEAMVSQAGELRPDVAEAYWLACELQSRANRATAEAIPWFRHLEVSYQYADRDQDSGYTGVTESSESGSGTRTRWTEYASGIERSEIRNRDEQSWSTEQESGSASSSRSEDEWTVETAVSIPIFDWMSGHGRAVRKTAKLAWKDVDEAVLDAERELSIRIQALKDALREAEMFDTQIYPEAQKLREQHDALYQSGRLLPADSVQLMEQISEAVEEGLAAREAVDTALTTLWIACGAPMEMP